MLQKGTLYLIPIPIAEGMVSTLSSLAIESVPEIKHYFVENTRTARRFLKLVQPSIIIDELQFSEIDKHQGADVNTLRQWLNNGLKVGVMSESGCPGIADPGAELVAVAQSMNAHVIPLVGPNSLILALMASGLNGQSFCFNGYLPVKEPARSQKIKQLEQTSKKENQTQLFIETPYRNNNLLEDFLKNCSDNTRLCIAQNITAPNQFIKTKKIADWKKQKPVLEKLPAVFLMLG
ncbi:MAG TPA: SAM-dependent methyltransferase [Flavipsychrobacter sp.]|nr:SAM-dependent methyltransferase [Flavipsychrobacter sp.]